MLHYTLNTDHTRHSPRSEVSDAAIAALTPLVVPGDHIIPGAPRYLCTTTTQGSALIATASQGQRPCVTMGVAPDAAAADAIWPHLQSAYLAACDLPGLRSADFAAPHRPGKHPWCAAIVITATPDEALWLGDFERCLAWAWLTSKGLDQ